MRQRNHERPRPQFDLKVLRFIHRHGGHVTVRQLAHNLATCRRASDAQGQLDTLVRLKLGIWTYPRPSRAGGRPSPTFVLTAPKESLAPLIHRATEAFPLRGSTATRRIAREAIELSNRYPNMKCEQIAAGFSQAADVLREFAGNDLPWFDRHISLGFRGSTTVTSGTWTNNGRC